MVGHQVNFYDGGASQFHYGNIGPYHHQEKTNQKQRVDSPKLDAIQWIRNLDQDEQGNVMAWTLPSATMTGLIRGRYSGSAALSPNLYNGGASSSYHFSPYGEYQFKIQVN